MKISILIIEFRLPGCKSLKEKRQRMSALKPKYGKQLNIAVCENNFQNNYQKAEWSFVILGHTNKIIDATISNIENNLEMIVDATIVNVDRENFY